MIGNQIPESLRMIFNLNVAKFMYNDIFKYRRRRQDQEPIDIDVVMYAATAPAAFLGFDGNRAGKKQLGRSMAFNELFNMQPGLHFHPANQGIFNMIAGVIEGVVFRDISYKFLKKLNFYLF